MKHVQPFGLVLIEHRGHHRINKRLHRAISQAKDDAAPIKQLIPALLCRVEVSTVRAMNRFIRSERQRAVSQITSEGKNHGFLVADAVNEQAEQDDAHSERPDARPRELAGGHFIEPEIRDELPAAKNHPADKRVGRSYERDEAAPEQDFVLVVVHEFFRDVECQLTDAAPTGAVFKPKSLAR